MGMKTPKQMLNELQTAGFSQSEIARQSGIEQATISRISSGIHANPRFSSVLAISNFYDKKRRSLKRVGL